MTQFANKLTALVATALLSTALLLGAVGPATTIGQTAHETARALA